MKVDQGCKTILWRDPQSPHAMTCAKRDEALLLEPHHCLAHWRATDAKKVSGLQLKEMRAGRSWSSGSSASARDRRCGSGTMNRVWLLLAAA
jgi:hypothetical protein